MDGLGQTSDDVTRIQAAQDFSDPGATLGHMSRRLLPAAAAAVAASLISVGPGLARPETTNPAATIPIKMTVTDRVIRMSPSSASRGQAGLFIVVNRGTKVHTIVVKDVGAGKRPSFTATVRPDQQKTFVMFLDYRGLVHARSTDGVLQGTFKVT